MPVYEFYCEKCDNTTEGVYKFDEDPVVQCGNCGGLRKRVISGTKYSTGIAPAFNLNGEGWPSKKFRVEGQMKTRQRRVKKKGFEIPERELIPNYEGETTKNWTQAKEAARQKGTPVEEGSSERRPLTKEELGTFDKRIEQVDKEKEAKKATWEDVKTV